MTSKSLFFKLIKQDLKNRIWCPILIFIGYFLAFEVVLLMQLEAIAKDPMDFTYTASEYVADIFLGNSDVMYILIICLTAAVCGISGFIYLNSKIQLDTFHSMPVSRTTLFLSRYVSGILQFLVPFIIHIMICLIISVTQNAFTMKALTNAIVFIGVGLLFFVLAYGSVLLAVCLTGNTIITVLGSIVIFCYSYLLSVLVEILFDKFFDTYFYYGIESNLKIAAFSPLQIIVKYNYLQEKNINGSNGYLVVVFIAAVVYSIISYLLYKNRASEAAGKAIAFEWAKPVLKTLIVIPAALYSGLFFNSIAPDYDDLKWFVFGVLFGYFVISLLIEVIFELDIRSAFKHKKQLVFNAVCTLLIVVIFNYDIFGYDTYVPNDKQLESTAVSIQSLVDSYEIVRNPYGGYDYINSEEYSFENMHIADNPSVIELAEKLAAEGIQHEEISYYEGIENTEEYQEIQKKEAGYRPVVFCYNKTNGKKVYRRYMADIADEQTVKLISDIFGDTEFKLGSTPLFNKSFRIEYSGISCKGNFEEKQISLNKDEVLNLIQVYQEEYMKLSLETVRSTIPVGSIGFVEKEDNFYSSDYVIYPEFTKTIELIKEYGFDFDKQPVIDDIYKISVEKYVEDDAAYSVYTKEVEFFDFNDKTEIEKILPCIVDTDVSNHNYMFAQDLYDIENCGSICVEKMNGEIYYGYFKKGHIPDFVLERIGVIK